MISLGDLDRRTKAARQAEQLLDAIVDDLGGSRNVTAGQLALARRASVLAALVEDGEVRALRGDAFDLAGHLAAVNALRRLVATLGCLERRTRPAGVMGLDDYLAREQAT